MATETAPTLEDWRDLYEHARVFRANAPWEAFADDQLFAVVDPRTQETAYCCVLGAGGIEYGLAVYRGSAGVKAYLMAAVGACDSEEMMLAQDCLSFLLGDREMLGPEERSLQKALGFKFRGKGAWPLFRSYRPGYLAATCRREEVWLLATCLQQTWALIQDVLAGVRVPKFTPGTRILARQRDQRGVWEITTVPFPIPPAGPRIEVPETRIKGLQQSLPRTPETWQVGVQVIAPVEEGFDAPYWAWMLMCVDAKMGTIHSFNIGGPQDTVQGQFLSAVEKAGFLPRELQMTSPLLHSQLEPIARPLGVKIRQVSRLRALDHASGSLKQAFLRR